VKESPSSVFVGSSRQDQPRRSRSRSRSGGRRCIARFRFPYVDPTTVTSGGRPRRIRDAMIILSSATLAGDPVGARRCISSPSPPRDLFQDQSSHPSHASSLALTLPPSSSLASPPFRFVARRPFAGYTSRRAAGNGLTVGERQLLPRKRFPSKLHLKNMI